MANRGDDASSDSAKGYLYLDPKQAPAKPAMGMFGGGGGGGASGPRQREPFGEAMVFMVGGGSYLEARQLAGFAASCEPPRAVSYGCTDLLSARQFLKCFEGIGS